MIKIETTPNLAGVRISGDYDDLYNLNNAFYDITIDEFDEKNKEYIDMSMRLLGLSYDIRHASQGDRDVEAVDNGMDREKMKYLSMIVPDRNVYYSCNYMYPEMIYCMLAINTLIPLKVRELTSQKYTLDEMHHKKVVWNKTISTLRMFQSAMSECMKDTLSKQSCAMWLNKLNSKNINLNHMLNQYIDVLNVEFLSWDKEKRLKNLFKVAKRIVEFNRDDEYCDIEMGIMNYAVKNNVPIRDVRLEDIEYPEDIEW